MFKPIGKLDSGFYTGFETLSAEQAREALLEAWSTPEQRAYNASTTQCRECKGWGYRIIRKGRETIREKAGCPLCLGLGKLVSDQSAEASAA